MVIIVDYGVGNVRAFANVFSELAIPYKVAVCETDLTRATRLLIPGVGSFDLALNRLRSMPFFLSLSKLVSEVKVPTLGVCIGMHMFADSSEEGASTGLGWIGGRVKKVSFPDSNAPLPLPHMGWNTIEANNSHLFTSIAPEEEFYFLHSYFFDCKDENDCIATVDYGARMPCAVQKENVVGVQFHPEKSHKSGARLLKNFATGDLC